MSTAFGARRIVCLLGLGAAAALVWAGLASAEVANPDGIAVIIGNRDYEHTENVEFAHRDADAFKRYVVDLLGFDPDRILHLRDAGLTQMVKAFGSQGSHRGQVSRLLKAKRRSDVVVFYSGHGVPGLNDKRGYLMPVDAEPDFAELQGYSLDLLHKNLGKLPARSVTVYVDACFSGDSDAGMLFRNASPVRTQARLPEMGDGRVTLLTAASGKELASWDRKAKHGLFTTHLLDGLYGAADLNQDGRVTAGEAKEYLDDHMTQAAQALGRDQHATLRGGAERVLSVARFPARSQREGKARGEELEKMRKEMASLEKERDAEVRARLDRDAKLDQVRREKEALEQERQRLAGQVAEQQAELEQLRQQPARDRTEEGLGLEHSHFMAIQWGLVSLGKKIGRVDGVFGQRTRAAIREWQVENGLAETGRLTRDQAVALMAVGKAELARPRREFRDCPDCPEMVVVGAGEYWMGSPEGEADRAGDEGPRYRVRIGEAFAVGKYEVTFEEWDACVAGGGCRGYRPDDAGWGRGRRPVINVSWEDAKAYVMWLSRKTGTRYRLLSEEEWEYVARAGTGRRYTWGDYVGRNRANCDGCGSRWDNEKTAAVGSFGANGYGLHDVHGNVLEWVEDCWHPNYHGAPADGSAWVTGGDCSDRVVRGGSWYDAPRNLRSAGRTGSRAGARGVGYGFRVARTLAW